MHALDNKMLLRMPIAELPFTKEFRLMAETNGFTNLDEVLSLHLSSLMRKKGFTPDVQQELVEFLHEENLLHLLKQA